MHPQLFRDKLELLIILSDITESVTLELNREISDSILDMKVMKVKTATKSLNVQLSKLIENDIQYAMGDYIDNARELLENYIKNYNR